MSTTVAETLLTTLATLLTSACAGMKVERSRVVALEREDLPALIIKPKEESAQLMANNLQQCEFTVEIEIHTRGDVPDQLADPIAATANQALMADPTLSGQCTRLHYVSRAWEFADSDRTGGQLTLTYRITYLTPARDFTRQP